MANYKGKITQGISQEFIDEETGEITRQMVITETIDGFSDLKLPTKHRLNNGNFLIIFQKAMAEISKNGKNFTRNEFHLLFHFLGSAGIGNSIYCDYPTLVEELGINRGNCVTALNSLIKKGIVLKKSTGSRSKNEAALMNVRINFDQLNYNFAYNGKIKDFKKVQYDHPPLSIENTNEPKQLDLFE
jgi:hypothetical protein